MSDKKIIAYQVVRAGWLGESIVVVVNKEIENGWQPLGGVATDGNSRYFQAMVKYE